MNKASLFILFLISCCCSFGQMTMQDIDDKKTLSRIEFIKANTDSFLLRHFEKKIQSKFKFEYSHSRIDYGDMLISYQSVNSLKAPLENISGVIHNYKFLDKGINLKTNINIYFWKYKAIGMWFNSNEDSLNYEALNKIYNKGLLPKIKEKIIEAKLKDPYTEIEADIKNNRFYIILKDRSSPHNFYIDQNCFL